MKKILLLFISVWIINVSIGQVDVNVGKDACTHCNMLIKDQRFMAIAIDANGKSEKFDAIECLVNFLKEHDESKFQKLLVADYQQPGSTIIAQEAFYLKSKEIASPMGAYLSAYDSREIAEKIQKQKGGELYNWDELKAKFKDSRFGLLDHPTHHHHRPDAYAPIGIMGDHLHHRGGLMMSARYMRMEMEGNLDGSEEISNMSVFQRYMVAPQTMRMDMLMFGLMYAPSDKMTIMLMQNFLRNEMDLRTMMGVNFTTKSQGLSDLKISVLYGLISSEQTSFHLNAGVSIPTGSIKNQDDTPMGENMRLPYPMQLGSGTVDLTVGGTYKSSSDTWSWGAQPLVLVRTGESSEGYRWGNEFLVNSWIGYKLEDWASVAVQLTGKRQLKMKGEDDNLNPMMVTTADTENTGFTRVYSALAANFSFGDSPILRDFKAGISYRLPIYQEVNGIQMNERKSFIVGLRYSI